MAQGEFHAIAASLPDPFHLLVRENATSTNDELRALAENGAKEGLILLAENQSAGRGRRGAAWFSPSGESLAFSILLRPQAPKALWPRLALASGLALAEAFGKMGAEALIKWPNDVWLQQRKVAGILVESGKDFVIVGIGINVTTLEFPPEVAAIATSLQLAMGRPFLRADVLAAVIHQLSQRCAQIGNHFDEVLDGVRLRCALTGQHVSLLTSSGPKTGWIEGISPGGELILRTSYGVETLMQADEIRLMPL